MNWSEYVILARGMARHPSEGMARSAVSRAYYGAFNLSRRWLEMNVTPIEDRRAHLEVWSTFQLADRATPDTRAGWQLIGNLGGGLRELRNQADYDDLLPDIRYRAPKAVSTAERILELLPALEVA